VAASRAGDRLGFIGYVDRVTTALHAIDVLVVPSLIDGRPATIMEANACGVPVIATRVGGIPEMIRDGENGVLFDLSDIAPVAAALRRWRDDRRELDGMRIRSRVFAKANFSVELMLRGYEAIFARYAPAMFSAAAATGAVGV